VVYGKRCVAIFCIGEENFPGNSEGQTVIFSDKALFLPRN
jgi:hypothetical protein